MRKNENTEEQHQVYGIPRNLKSAGKIADAIEVTGMVQSIIFALLLLLFCLKVLHIPMKITGIIVIVALILTVMPYGKNSDTFCRYIYLVLRNLLVRKTYRRYIKHQSIEQKKMEKQRIV